MKIIASIFTVCLLSYKLINIVPVKFTKKTLNDSSSMNSCYDSKVVTLIMKDCHISNEKFKETSDVCYMLFPENKILY